MGREIERERLREAGTERARYRGGWERERGG
jgi:hypothetical protein